MKGLSVKTSAVSMFDVSVRRRVAFPIDASAPLFRSKGLTVFSTDVRLAEDIAQQRTFIMKYDCEIPVHDVLGRQTGEQPVGRAVRMLVLC